MLALVAIKPNKNTLLTRSRQSFQNRRSSFSNEIRFAVPRASETGVTSRRYRNEKGNST
jgi:hypothetical protein